MMPLAPTPVMSAMPTSKPKIGFSIDSIVGNRNNSSKSESNYSQDSDNSENPASPLSECGQTNDQISSYNLSVDIKRALRLQQQSDELNIYNKLAKYRSVSPGSTEHQLPPSSHHPSSTKTDVINKSPSPILNISSCNESSDAASPPPPSHQLPPQHPAAIQSTKAPIIVPGIPAGYVRPFAQSAAADFKSLPPYHPSDLVQPHNTHLLAAQFTAAALANQSFPPHAAQHPAAHLHNPNLPRDSYPLYPWLLSRHGRIFPHRFPGSK